MPGNNLELFGGTSWQRCSIGRCTCCRRYAPYSSSAPTDSRPTNRFHAGSLFASDLGRQFSKKTAVTSKSMLDSYSGHEIVFSSRFK